MKLQIVLVAVMISFNSVLVSVFLSVLVAYLTLEIYWNIVVTFRNSHWKCSVKKSVLRNFAKFTGKYLCQSLFFNKVAACNFIENETLKQVFSCEFCEISKNTIFIEHPGRLLLNIQWFDITTQIPLLNDFQRPAL